MLTVDDYGQIRRAHRDGMSVRAIARTFGHSRRSVRKALGQAEPSRYTLAQARAAPKLGRFYGVIDQILKDDEQAPRKQRHTAKQIYRRLCDEHGYHGGYDQVRRYVGRQGKAKQQTFIPLSHDPGQRLEADFGHIYVDYPDGRRQVPVFLTTWSYSHARFAMKMPTERTEAVLSGMVEAFTFFECVPREVWTDNPKTVATAILQGRQRQLHDRYAALASHYAFEPICCMPRSAWEKPDVEHSVFDLQRRWATPVPKVQDDDQLNAYLRRCCLGELERTVSGQTQTIGERFAHDKAAAAELPPQVFDPYVPQTAKVDKYQTVAFDTNRYSVPRPYAFGTVGIKAYIDHVEMTAGGVVVATHRRDYQRHQQVLDPQHYLVALGRRPAALDHAPVYRDWKLPPVFTELRQKLERRHGPHSGARQYIRVLQLLAEHPTERLGRAIEQTAEVPDADLIRRCVERLAQREGLTSAQDVVIDQPELVCPQVPMPDLGQFNQLLSSGVSCHEQTTGPRQA